MSAYTPLKAVVLTAGEIAAASAAASGYPDAQGMLSTILNELAEANIKLTKLAAAIGAGSNATVMTTAATTIS